MKKTVSSLLLCLTASLGWAGSFTVSDPQQWNSAMQGNVEEMRTSVSMHGAYARYDIELMLSCKDHSAADTALLESVVSFSLPEEASVIDASLLIEGVWTPGDLMERGLATDTYESIVKRRRDPLLFVRDNKTDYTMKIYPVLKTEARSMRFSYLLPVTNKDTVSSIFVDTQFKLYSRQQPRVNVFSFAGEGVRELRSKDGIRILADKSVFSCDLNAATASSLTFEAVHAVQQDVVLSTAKYGKEQYFTLSISPEVLYKNKVLSGKYIFVLDHDPTAKNYSYYTYAQEQSYYESWDGQKYWYYPYLQKDSAVSAVVFSSSALKLVLNTVNSADSILFIYPDATGKMVKTGYAPATESAVDALFDTMHVSTGDYNALFGALFAETNSIRSSNANVVVLSNNTSYITDRNAGIALAQKLDSLSNKDVRMTVLSLEQPTGYTDQSSNRFFTTLASLSKSPVVKCSTIGQLKEASLADLIRERQNDFVRSVSVGISAVNGIIYNRHDNIDRVVGRNKPCLLSGKFTKADSFTVDIVIETADSLYAQQIQLPVGAIGQDSLVRTAWAAQQLTELEEDLLIERQQIYAEYDYYYYYYWTPDYNSYPRYLALRQEIISLSIEQRILCTETAFLSLEPSMVVEGCKDCANTPRDNGFGNGGEWAVGEDSAEVFAASAAPNPFSSSVTIQIQDAAHSMDSCVIEITAASGEIVRTARCSGGQFVWDGTNDFGADVPSGLYFVTVRTKNALYRVIVVKE